MGPTYLLLRPWFTPWRHWLASDPLPWPEDPVAWRTYFTVSDHDLQSQGKGRSGKGLGKQKTARCGLKHYQSLLIWTLILHFVVLQPKMSPHLLVKLSLILHDGVQVASKKALLISTQIEFPPLSYHSTFWHLHTALPSLIFFKDFSLFLERGEGSEKKRGKHWCVRETSISCLSHAPQLGSRPATQAHGLTGNRTGDLSPHGTACGMMLSQLPHAGHGCSAITY